jgi:hypothetical protein
MKGGRSLSEIDQKQRSNTRQYCSRKVRNVLYNGEGGREGWSMCMDRRVLGCMRCMGRMGWVVWVDEYSVELSEYCYGVIGYTSWPRYLTETAATRNRPKGTLPFTYRGHSR